MPTPRRRPIPGPSLALALGLAGILAACATPAPTPSPSPAPSAAASVAVATSPPPPTPILTQAPRATPIATPSDDAEPTDPPPGAGSTTETDWGTILDAVPEGFPVYPGASPMDDAPGPVSGAWLAKAGVDAVAAWYRRSLEALGFTTRDLSSPLEDGSRVLDTVSDLPECRIQTTFRPADGSTIISVLYGAGCAGGG